MYYNVEDFPKFISDLRKLLDKVIAAQASGSLTVQLSAREVELVEIAREMDEILGLDISTLQ